MRFVFFLLSMSAAPAIAGNAQAAAPTSVGNTSPAFTDRLQAYFVDAAQKQLGALEPWQSKLFTEEATPEYQRFIRDYKSSSGSGADVNAQIDFDALVHFLKYHSSEVKPVLVAIKSDPACAKCTESVAEVKAAIAQRLARRGLKPSWFTLSEIGKNATSSAAEIFEAAIPYSVQKNAAGALVMDWHQAPIDQEHPDDNQYTIHLAFALRGVSKTDGALDLTDNGSFSTSAGKLLTDAFTEAGSAMGKTAVAAADPGKEALTVEVKGFSGFSQYKDLRAKIEAALKGLATIEDRRVGGGKAVFAVYTKATSDQVQAALDQVKPPKDVSMRLEAP